MRHAYAGPGVPGSLGKAKEVVEQYVRGWRGSQVAIPSRAIAQSVRVPVGRVRGEGGHDCDHRRLPIGRPHLVDRHGDEQEHCLRTRNASHRRYYDVLIRHVRARRVDPQKVLTQAEPMTAAIKAYQACDEGRARGIKVEPDAAGDTVSRRLRRVP